MSTQLGRDHGVALFDYHSGLRVAETNASDEAARMREFAVRSVTEAREASERQQSTAARRLDLWKEAVAARASLEADRKRAPSEFSFLRGTIYMSLSFLLLLADFTLLGQVLARFLGLDWQDGSSNFATQFLNNVGAAYRSFPELMLLTLGVLILGMTAKLLRDAYVAITEGAASSQRQRVEYRVAVGLCVLAMLTLIGVSSLRLYLQVSDEFTGSFPRGVSALLGLTLPLLSAGFFIKGFDQISNSAHLQVARARTMIRHWSLDASEKRRAIVASRYAAAAAHATEVGSADYLQGLVYRNRCDYDRGYREGVAKLLPGGVDGLYDRLQPVLIQRSIAGDPSTAIKVR